MRHLERITGRGTATVGDEDHDVEYVLDIWQQMIDTGDGHQIPGIKRIDGNVLPAVGFFETEETVLRLSDGRVAHILWTSTDGTIVCNGIE